MNHPQIITSQQLKVIVIVIGQFFLQELNNCVLWNPILLVSWTQDLNKVQSWNPSNNEVMWLILKKYVSPVECLGVHYSNVTHLFRHSGFQEQNQMPAFLKTIIWL
jgi:hypothetical protein